MHTVSILLLAALVVVSILHVLLGTGIGILLARRSAARQKEATAQEDADIRSTFIQLSQSLATCHRRAAQQLDRIQRIVDAEVRSLVKGKDETARGRWRQTADELRQSSQQLRGIFEEGRNSVTMSALRLSPVSHGPGGRPSIPQNLLPPERRLPQNDETPDRLDAKHAQRVVFRCTQRFAVWNGTSVPPLEEFQAMQCLEISTSEVVFDCEDIPEQAELLIGLGMPSEFVMLRARVVKRQAVTGMSPLRYRCLCHLIERIDPCKDAQAAGPVAMAAARQSMPAEITE
jgi:hypothetical protein